MEITCSPVGVYVVPGRLRVHPIPKAGSDAITTAIKPFYRTREHVDVAGPEYRWAVVRHPLERIVSGWAYFCAEDRLRNQAALRQIGYRAGMPFTEFLDVVLEHAGANNHTCPQGVHLGPHPFDRIGRLENLAGEWEALKRRFPFITTTVGRRNASRHDPWPSYYTGRMRQRAERTFAADMELYEGSDATPPME